MSGDVFTLTSGQMSHSAISSRVDKGILFSDEDSWTTRYGRALALYRQMTQLDSLSKLSKAVCY